MNWKTILTLALLFLPPLSTNSFAQENEINRHIEVRVELTNESILEGIVVDGKFYEKYNTRRNRWQVMPSRKGAGLRLYHVGKEEGFIFLNYESEIKRLEEIGKLSETQLRIIRREIEAKKIEEHGFEVKIPKEQSVEEGSSPNSPETEKMEKTEKEPETEKSTLDPKTLKEYSRVLEKYPSEKFSLDSTVEALKIRMSSGIPLGKYKDFVLDYETLLKAKAYQNSEPLPDHYSGKEIEEAQRILGSYPPKDFDIAKKVQQFSSEALRELPMNPKDAEWLSVLDHWLKAKATLAWVAEQENQTGKE